MAIVKWQQALFKLIAVCGLLSWDQGKKGLPKEVMNQLSG